VLVAVAGWTLFWSPFLTARVVRVTGTTALVPGSRVIAAAAIPAGLPLARLDTGGVARRVERIRQVQSASVSIGWPDEVTITVRPRVAVFAVPDAGRYVLVDRFGVSVAQAGSRDGLPVLRPPAGGRLRGSRSVRAAAAVLAELPARFARQARLVTASSPVNVSVTLADGSVIIWGGPASGKEKAAEMTALARRRARVYDVSVPGMAQTKG